MYSAGPSTDHTSGERELACPRMLWSEGPQKAGHAGGSAAAAVFFLCFRGGQHTTLQTQKGSNPQIPWKCQPRLRKCQKS